MSPGKLDFIERQRLSSISSAVIPVGEEDDPLALQAPKLVDSRWELGQLTLILDRPVTVGWVHSLWNISATSVLGKGPRAFAFTGNEASISADPHEVQPLINHFKDWLGLATDLHRRIRADGRKHAADRERAALKAEQDELEQRRRLREQIRL